MSVWVLHQALAPQEEDSVESRTHLTLPLEGISDLSMVASEVECRHLLRALYPDDPPEMIGRRIERTWRLYSGLHPEDIIAVPLKARREVALAQVSGRYEYGNGEHLIQVTWYGTRISFSRLGRHQGYIMGREGMFEITDAQVRIALRDRLPHKYNRFARWKWLMVLFFGLSAVSFLAQMLR